MASSWVGGESSCDSGNHKKGGPRVGTMKLHVVGLLVAVAFAGCSSEETPTTSPTPAPLSIELVRDVPYKDHVQTFRVSAVSPGATWEDLDLRYDLGALTLDTDTTCTVPEGLEYVACAGPQRLADADPISVDDRLTVNVEKHGGFLTVQDVATKNSLFKIVVG